MEPKKNLGDLTPYLTYGAKQSYESIGHLLYSTMMKYALTGSHFFPVRKVKNILADASSQHTTIH
jgi:hypothetical protein